MFRSEFFRDFFGILVFSNRFFSGFIRSFGVNILALALKGYLDDIQELVESDDYLLDWPKDTEERIERVSRR